MSVTTTRAGPESRPADPTTVYGILVMISAAHFMNDVIQSLVPSIYPILKQAFGLDFGQVGTISLVWQLTASVFQPIVGIYTDRHPQPFSLAAGMGCTLTGVVLLSQATDYTAILVAVAMIGLGSAVFHPESSRVARMASGGRHGLAQSLFQVGGNTGQAAGPLLAAFLVLPHGQGAVVWFAPMAVIGMMVLGRVGFWYRQHRRATAGRPAAAASPALPRGVVIRAVAVLCALCFSKYFYFAALNDYFTFYMIEKFQATIGQAQICLFVFLASAAAGTLFGGSLGDRFGRRAVIWFSILGVLPFTLALPHMGFVGAIACTVFIGLIMSSAFPAIVVYAQELLPARVGTVAGLFFGLAFGLGGVGAAALGHLADATSLSFMLNLCAFLPAIGVLAWFLPDLRRRPAG